MPTAADILIDTPIDWRVKVVFGLPHPAPVLAGEPLRTMIRDGGDCDD